MRGFLFYKKSTGFKSNQEEGEEVNQTMGSAFQSRARGQSQEGPQITHETLRQKKTQCKRPGEAMCSPHGLPFQPLGHTCLLFRLVFLFVSKLFNASAILEHLAFLSLSLHRQSQSLNKYYICFTLLKEHTQLLENIAALLSTQMYPRLPAANRINLQSVSVYQYQSCLSNERDTAASHHY